MSVKKFISARPLSYEAVIRASIATFEADPPDDEFQRGYLTALRDVLEDMAMTGEPANLRPV